MINRTLYIVGVELINASDVARELDVSRQYVSKLVRTGLLPGVKVGRYRLFEREAVQAFAEKRRKTKAQTTGIDSGGNSAQDVAE